MSYNLYNKYIKCRIPGYTFVSLLAIKQNNIINLYFFILHKTQNYNTTVIVILFVLKYKIKFMDDKIKNYKIDDRIYMYTVNSKYIYINSWTMRSGRKLIITETYLFRIHDSCYTYSAYFLAFDIKYFLVSSLFTTLSIFLQDFILKSRVFNECIKNSGLIIKKLLHGSKLRNRTCEMVQ
jgi:hypothetical protein